MHLIDWSCPLSHSRRRRRDTFSPFPASFSSVATFFFSFLSKTSSWFFHLRLVCRCPVEATQSTVDQFISLFYSGGGGGLEDGRLMDVGHLMQQQQQLGLQQQQQQQQQQMNLYGVVGVAQHPHQLQQLQQVQQIHQLQHPPRTASSTSSSSAGSSSSPSSTPQVSSLNGNVKMTSSSNGTAAGGRKYQCKMCPQVGTHTIPF